MKTPTKTALTFLAIVCLLCTTANALELVRQKNEATVIQFPLVDADGDPVSAATNLDSEYSYHDLGGESWSTFTDCNTEATENASSGAYTLTVAQAEMNHDFVQLKIGSNEAKTQLVHIRTIVGAPELQATTDDGGAINVTNGKVDEVATLTGHTPQTADHAANISAILDDTSSYDTDAEHAQAIWGAARADYDAAGTFGRASQVIHDGTAQDGNTERIWLDAAASGEMSFYNDAVILITGGTGAGQSRRIEMYYGDIWDKIADITPAWTVVPNSSSQFVILPATWSMAELVPGEVQTPPSVSSISAAVWNEYSTGHTTSGRAGYQLWTVLNAIKAKTDNLPEDPAEDADFDYVNSKVYTINNNVATILSRVPSEVAQKQHLVSGSGDITPPYNKGLWDAIGTLPEVQATVSPTVHCLLIDLFGAMDAAAQSIIDLQDGIWDYNIEGNYSAAAMLRLCLSVLAGPSDRDGPTQTFRDIADTKDRVTVTNPRAGVRSAVMLDGD